MDDGGLAVNESLRDRFAGLAMQALIVSKYVSADTMSAFYELESERGIGPTTLLAQLADSYADAMLAERHKKNATDGSDVTSLNDTVSRIDGESYGP